MSARPPPLPAPDLFEHRRARAGIPDYEPLPAALEAALAGATLWPAFEACDVPPPRPMRPALDGEAP
jgi:hypothetical protein